MKLFRSKLINNASLCALVLAFLFFLAAIAFSEKPTSAQSLFTPPVSRFSLGQPSTRVFSVGDLEFASVHLDGVPLFQVASAKFAPSESEPVGSLSPIERRVQRIEGNLLNLVKNGFDPQTLEVKPSTLNNLTVIVASDQKNLAHQVILTVNELDAQLNPSITTNLAEQWSQILRQALIRAWQERQPEARKQQISTGFKIVLGMIILGLLLLGLQKWLKRQFNALKRKALAQAMTALAVDSPTAFKETLPLSSASPEVLAEFRQQAHLQQRLTLNLLLQRLDQVGLILLLFGSIAAIFYVFPETRWVARTVVGIPLRIFVIWLVLTIICNVVNLYVNYKLQEWVEQALVFSEDPQRRILRSPTLLEVSRGIITFAAWCIGILWFLLWKQVFPSSLLTGAGLVGAGLTFAFRDLFKDWIMGILILMEDQYAVGDMIEFEGRVGVVEAMSLRATQIRSADGRLSTISHNQIVAAHNLSKDWSRVNFTIEVAYDTDPNFAIAVMKQVAQTMAQEVQWQSDILDPVNVIGVDRVTHAGLEIMMRIRVKRLRQWDVEREFRRRLKIAFDEQGIQIGVPRRNLVLEDNTTYP
jgi:small conductance mechanosensitive channel